MRLYGELFENNEYLNVTLLQKLDLLNYLYNEGSAKCDTFNVYNGIQLLKFCAKKLVS